MQVDPIIAPLIHSSKLPVYIEELTAFYNEEKKKRQAFYEWLSDDVKAEFIEGERIMHSPAKNRHIEASGNFYRLLSVYVDLRDLGSVKMEKALVKLSRNDFEPDVCFFNKEKTATFQKVTMFFPAPELVVEVLSDSTEARDRGIKFKDYASHGVQEYWIIDADQEIVEQYLLSGEQYILHVKVKDGSVSSSVVSGFNIPVAAIFNKQENMKMLQRLLAL